MHGASEEAFDQITKQIGTDQKDKIGMISMVTSMRDVMQYRDMGHVEAARKIRLSCGRLFRLSLRLNAIYRGFYRSVHVLLNLFNQFRKKDQT